MELRLKKGKEDVQVDLLEEIQMLRREREELGDQLKAMEVSLGLERHHNQRHHQERFHKACDT